MTPSFPIDLPAGSVFMETAEPGTCGMIRSGVTCGNDAMYAFICPEKYAQRIVHVCQMCIDDSPGWIQDLERAAGQGRVRIAD